MAVSQGNPAGPWAARQPPLGNRERSLAGRRFAFCLAVGLVAAFALGSIGPFLALDWPPLLRQALFGLLIAFLILRIAKVVGHFLLAPGHERFRIVPKRQPRVSGSVGSFGSSAGLPSVG